MNASDRHARIGLLLFTIVSAASLSACGGKKAPAGQVLATVDGEELTMAQLETLLPTSSSRNPGLAAKAVDSLIDETLFMRAAEREGIDRDPAVVREVEKARRAVLTQAYMKKITPNTPISPDEIRLYYDRFPQFFKERRRYLVTDMLVKSGGGPDLNKFIAPLGNQLSLEELINEMRRRRADIDVRNFEFSSDSVTPEMALQFARVSEGQSYSFPEGSWRHFGRVEAVVAQPVSFPDAIQPIRNRLLAQRVEQAAREKLGALRRSDQVVMGELGKRMLAAGPDAAQPANSATPPARAKGVDDAARKRAIERGLRGI